MHQKEIRSCWNC